MSEIRIAMADIRQTALVVDGADRLLVFPRGTIDEYLLERANVLLRLAETE